MMLDPNTVGDVELPLEFQALFQATSGSPTSRTVRRCCWRVRAAGKSARVSPTEQQDLRQNRFNKREYESTDY